ncbi:hypothetical protein ROZALSC1DRAFT_27659, partial [Rozella allomycis CSF55]
LEICNFSGYKIYPGRGRTFVRAHFLAKKNPRKFLWTQVYRRLNKKGINADEVAKKKTRKNVKFQRAIAGVSVEQLKAKRTQPPEVRAAARAEAIKKAKAKKAESEAKKKEEKAKQTANRAQAKQTKASKPAKASKAQMKRY